MGRPSYAADTIQSYLTDSKNYQIRLHPVSNKLDQGFLVYLEWRSGPRRGEEVARGWGANIDEALRSMEDDFFRHPQPSPPKRERVR